MSNACIPGQPYDTWTVARRASGAVDVTVHHSRPQQVCENGRWVTRDVVTMETRSFPDVASASAFLRAQGHGDAQAQALAALARPSSSARRPARTQPITRDQTLAGARLVGMTVPSSPNAAQTTTVSRQVRAVQRELQRIGVNLGPTGADGRVGQFTQAGVDQVLARHPMPAGAPPSALLAHLQSIQSC